MTLDRFPGELPQTIEAERACLGAAIMDAQAAEQVARETSVEDYTTDAHRALWRGIQVLVARGDPVDRLTVYHEIYRTGAHELVPSTMLLDLEAATPTPSHIAAYLGKVRETARRRRLIIAGTSFVERVRQNGGDPLGARDDFLKQTRDLGAEAPKSSPPELEPPVAILRRSRNQGEPIPTGIAGFDERTRGGLREGRAFVVAGTPGVGKTSLALQAGLSGARAGCAVSLLAIDEGRELAIIRLGQQFGFERDLLEHQHEPTLDAMEAELAGLAYHFPDSDADGDTSIEAEAERLVKTYPDRRHLLIIDSVQSAVRSGKVGELMGDRSPLHERTMRAAKMLRNLARSYPMAVLYTAETTRAWYRSRKAEERASDLASPADARIEYSADVLLTLRAVESDQDLIEAGVAKNRLGDRAPFWMRFDRKRALLATVEAGPAAAIQDAALAKRVEEQTEKILRALKQHGELSRVQLWEAVLGNREAFGEALSGAKASGLVFVVKTGRSMLHRLTEVPF